MKSRFLSWTYNAAELQDRVEVIQRLLKAISDVHVGTHERAMVQAEGDFMKGVNSLMFQQAFSQALNTSFKHEVPTTSKEVAVMGAIRDAVTWVRSPVYLPRILDDEVWEKEAPNIGISSDYIQEPDETAGLDEAFHFAFFNLSRAAGKLVAIQAISMLLSYDYRWAEKEISDSAGALREATWQKIIRFERDVLLFAAMKGDPATLKIAARATALASCWHPQESSNNYELSNFVTADGRPRGYIASSLTTSLRRAIHDAMEKMR